MFYYKKICSDKTIGLIETAIYLNDKNFPNYINITKDEYMVLKNSKKYFLEPYFSIESFVNEKNMLEKAYNIYFLSNR